METIKSHLIEKTKLLKDNFIEVPKLEARLLLAKTFNKNLKSFNDFKISSNDLIIDGIFGSGLKRNISGNLKKIVLLGDMLELGKKTKKLHKELSNVINESDVDKVFVMEKI